MPNLKILVDKDNRNHVIDADEITSAGYEYPSCSKEIIVSILFKGDATLRCNTLQLAFASQDAANLELSKLVIQ